MRPDEADRLRQQAAWQRQRAALPWPEKVRQALVLREAAAKLRSARTKPSAADAPPTKR